MPSLFLPALLVLTFSWPLSALDDADQREPACTVSIAPLPEVIAHQSGPIPLAWTLTNTSANGIDIDPIECDIDFDQLEVRFAELPVAGQEAISFSAMESNAYITGPRLREPMLPPGAQLRHTLILNRYCLAIPPGVHRLSWKQQAPGIPSAISRRAWVELTGTVTVTVLPGTDPHAAELATELYRTYLDAADKRQRSEAVRQLSYLLSPAVTPCMATILQGEEAAGLKAAVDFLDRMRDHAEARMLLDTVYLHHHDAASSRALRNLERRGELPDPATLHVMLTGGDLGIRFGALEHLFLVASRKTAAERRELVARKAIPLDDLLALMASPAQSQRDHALQVLNCFEVVVPLPR
jgi:hypothetical protein